MVRLSVAGMEQLFRVASMKTQRGGMWANRYRHALGLKPALM